jgi:hypothetical protein
MNAPIFSKGEMPRTTRRAGRFSAQPANTNCLLMLPDRSSIASVVEKPDRCAPSSSLPSARHYRRREPSIYLSEV